METVKLIDGTYPVAEAKEILLGLLDYKINFHAKENFRSEIKKGVKDSASLKRMAELSEERKMLTTYFKGLTPETTITLSAIIHLKDVS